MLLNVGCTTTLFFFDVGLSAAVRRLLTLKDGIINCRWHFWGVRGGMCIVVFVVFGCWIHFFMFFSTLFVVLIFCYFTTTSWYLVPKRFLAFDTHGTHCQMANEYSSSCTKCVS